MRRIFIQLAFLPLAFSLFSGCGQKHIHKQSNSSSPSAPTIGYLSNATKAVETLQTWYVPSTGLYETTGWWNSANAVTVLADFARVSKSEQYASVLSNTFDAAQKTSPAFLNNFYDDEGWWALAWIDAYDLTRDAKYLSMAETIFADMAASWDDTCGGGIWWSKDKKYKNAIANELFLSLAAHLANRTSGAEQAKYLNWGNKEWAWFQASGMINSKNLVNDGLGNGQSQTSGAGCVNNGQTTWTYNQGVVVGGLAELSIANPDPSILVAAHKIAIAATTLLVDGKGILHDPCEPHCGADGVQFKGIFVRNLVLLDDKQSQKTNERFVYKNADSIWKNAQGANFQLGEVWSGPFGGGNAGIQTSALDAIIGAATLQKKSR